MPSSHPSNHHLFSYLLQPLPSSPCIKPCLLYCPTCSSQLCSFCYWRLKKRYLQSKQIIILRKKAHLGYTQVYKCLTNTPSTPRLQLRTSHISARTVPPLFQLQRWSLPLSVATKVNSLKESSKNRWKKNPTNPTGCLACNDWDREEKSQSTIALLRYIYSICILASKQNTGIYFAL